MVKDQILLSHKKTKIDRIHSDLLIRKEQEINNGDRYRCSSCCGWHTCYGYMHLFSKEETKT